MTLKKRQGLGKRVYGAIIMINKSLWAKKEIRDGNFYYLPLYIHLNDISQVMAYLWEHWLSSGQRNLLTSSISTKSSQDAKNLAVFIAAIHDLGKATPAFQTKKGYKNTKDQDDILIEKLVNDGFEGLDCLKLASAGQSHHSLASQYLLNQYGIGEDIASIVGSHHGRPSDSRDEIDRQFAYPANYYQSEKDDKIQRYWKDNQRQIIDWAMELSNFKQVSDLPQINLIGQVILTGLLIMADWISSNTKYFPLISVYDVDDTDLRDRALAGIRAWRKTSLWEGSYKANDREVFKQRFGFDLRESQEKFIATIKECKDPGIFIFEAPMGMGKTEASLYGLEVLAQKMGASGMYFALPTQATSNGIFPRVEGWLRKLADDSEDKLGLRLIHGKAYLNEDFLSLAKNINPDSDDTKEANILVNEWFSGRKSAILDDFIVGTIDQFLLLALKQKHIFLRHLGFSKKVIIIDEVHAYDAYMNQYLYQALRWMGAYKIPVIILSATLPYQKRSELINSYLLGRGLIKKDISYDKEVPIDTYPLITYNDGNIIKYADDFIKAKQKTIKLRKLDEANLTKLLEKLYSLGGNIGVIVNTVKKAQDLAREISASLGEDSYELIHSRFIDNQRIQKEGQLLKLIGRGGQRPDRKIYIGTQVIEQSLDIDFDIMLTELAPIDLMLQRMGRLHRHDIKRNKSNQTPNLYVFGTSDSLDFDQGTAKVYSPYILARSQAYLKDEIMIPEDLSSLVQKAYGHDPIDLGDNLVNKYLSFKEDYESLLKDKEVKAKKFRIGNPKLKHTNRRGGSLLGWLNNSNEVNTDTKAFAQVRDSMETIEVLVLEENTNGICIFGENEEILDKLDDPRIARKLAGSTLKLPQILCQPYNIDQTIKELESYNLKYLRDFDQSPWLRGSLGIVFDKNGCFEINNYNIIYSSKYGLMCERM